MENLKIIRIWINPWFKYKIRGEYGSIIISLNLKPTLTPVYLIKNKLFSIFIINKTHKKLKTKSRWSILGFNIGSFNFSFRLFTMFNGLNLFNSEIDFIVMRKREEKCNKPCPSLLFPNVKSIKNKKTICW